MQPIDLNPWKDPEKWIDPEIKHLDNNVKVGLGLTRMAGDLIAENSKARRAVILADPNAMKHHGERLFESLNRHFFLSAMVLPEGEIHKHMGTVSSIVNFLAEEEVQRDDLVITFGGGVTGDMGGFAASMYMRGIDCIHIPTTLMSQVDSSIGGKVGVNLKAGKNLVGHFHQPKMVLVDPELLSSLPKEEWQNGISELIKYAFTLDPKMLALLPPLSDMPEPSQWLSAITLAIELKLQIINEDPTEQGVRRVLNFGHTIGHSLEQLDGYQNLSHGEAVAVGMLLETQYGLKCYGGDEKTLEQLTKTVNRYNLARTTLKDLAKELSKPQLLNALTEALKMDKKANAKGLRFIWPKRLGEWSENRVEASALAAFVGEVWA